MTDDEIEKHHEQMAQIASLNPAVVEPSGHPILDDDRQRQYWDKYSQLYRTKLVRVPRSDFYDPVTGQTHTVIEEQRFFLLDHPLLQGHAPEVWMRYPNRNTQELYDPQTRRITIVKIPNLQPHRAIARRTALALGIDRERWMASRHEFVGRF